MTEKPQTTFSLEDFVTVGEENSITYNTLSLQETIDNISFPIFNVIDDYLEDFIAVSKEVSFTEDQKFKYKYRPKLLCEHIYGNGELYYIILLINGMCNMKEFNLNQNIRLIEKDKLIEIIKYIYKSEKSQIENYNENS